MTNRNIVVGILLVAVVLLVGVWAAGRDGVDFFEPGPIGAPETGAIQRLDEITENPDQFIGQQVTVQGEVDDVIGRNMIVLDVPGDIFNDEILVVSQQSISESVANAEGL